jgi:putative phosphonate metabolism protein
MPDFPRYGIYHVPDRDSALYRFGADWLGYDIYSGDELARPDAPANVADWAEIIRDPRVYGFHATLKAPFSLAEGVTEAGLLEAGRAFAAVPRPIPQFAPVLDQIGRFIAVIPSSRCAALDQLAADCVRSFDAFRTPLTEADRARRTPAALSPRQRDHLDHWGYPYVMEEFRFHMTLTGPLDATRRDTIVDLLRKRFRKIGLDSIAIDRFAILRQESRQHRFRIIAQFRLSSPIVSGTTLAS